MVDESDTGSEPRHQARQRPEALPPSWLSGILSIATDAIIFVDESLDILLFNEGAEAAFGYSRDEIVGKPLDVLIPARFRPRHGEHIRHFAAAKSGSRKMGERQEIYALHRNGTEFRAEASISKFISERGLTYAVVLRDITARAEAEAALRESEQRLWAFLNNSAVIGWMKDELGRYVFLSGNFERRFGNRFASWMGRTDFDVWPADIARDHRKHDLAVLQEDRSIEVVEETINADGSRSSWLSHKFPFRDAKGRRFVGGLAVDITERVKAQEALAQVNAELESRVDERTRELRGEMQRNQESQAAIARLQRMEALGQLTGGVAHDFNNLLTVISGNLQLIEMDLEDAKLKKYVEEALHAAEMGARLNQRLMTFAKQRRLAAATVDLNEQVIGVREMLRRSLGESVMLSTELGEDLWPVKVDPSEIENALVNLAINARDAMPGGGKLAVATRNVEIGPIDTPVAEGVPPGRYVQLSVSDTGQGMTPEVQARAFEPFFSTKEHGKGTGLGLSTIYGFVRQSGGAVVLDSAPGQGTTVRIYLPRLETVGDGPAESFKAAAPGKSAGETILVVEDNREVLQVTKRRIAALGYSVIETLDGQAALDILDSGQRVDLVLTDVVMPGGISGLDLARRIFARWPRLPVLLTSGFAGGSDALAEEGLAGLPLLEKPYSQAELEQALWSSLHGASDQAR